MQATKTKRFHNLYKVADSHKDDMKEQKKVILLLALLLLTPTILAQTSSYKSDFVVDGCELGEKGLAIGTCSNDGKYFCKASSQPGARPILQNTLIDVGACSLGQGNVGATQCCPSGYTCNGTAVICQQRIANCGSWTTQGDCQTNSCTWIDRGGTGVCVDRPTDYSCSVYATQGACEADVWNLGGTGIGTDQCGTTFTASYNGLTKGYVIAPSTCGCTWDAGACKLKYEIADDIYNANVEPRNSIECLKEFDAGACNEGSQEVSWTHSTRNQIGFTGSISGVLTAGACEDGSTQRTCGEPVFQLPFYSLLAIALTALLLIAYYSFILAPNIHIE